MKTQIQKTREEAQAESKGKRRSDRTVREEKKRAEEEESEGVQMRVSVVQVPQDVTIHLPSSS